MRPLIIAALLVATLLGCAGITATLAFEQYSTTKWLVTVLGPVVVLLLMATQRPVTYIASAMVAGLPFIPLDASVGGVRFSPVLAMLAVGVVVAFVTSERTGPKPASVGRNATVMGVVVAGLLLLPGALRGSAVAETFTQAAIVLGLAYLLLRSIRLDRQAPVFLLTSFAGMAGLQGVIAVREFSTGRAFNPYGNGIAARDASYFFSYEGAFRPSGTFFDPISLGNVLAIACAMAAVLACSHRFPVLLRLFFAATGLAATGGLVVTLSRMSWIGALAGLTVVAVLSPGWMRLRQVALCAAAGVVVSATAVTLAGDRLLERFNSIFDPTATGVSTAAGDQTRQQLWGAALDTFLAHPLWGVGIGNLNHYLVRRVGDSGPFSHAHSTYLQQLAESGILGALAMVSLFVGAVATIAVRLKATHRSDPIVLACAGALTAVAVVWTTDFTARYTAVLCCLAIPFILTAALGSQSERTEGGARPW